ncbi:MAG: hypothetical protein J0H88_15310 [Sphingomonadales bacterium]|nr:hypothetical protein [Sphingomonadales bacterium]
MRRSLCVTLALIAAASLSASPAHAQFAAEEPGELPADEGYDQTDAEADPYADADPYAEADPADPYAAEPAYGTASPQSIGDRSVADIATSVLGNKGAQRVQDAETIVRTVIRKAGRHGGAPGSPGTDPLGLVQDILTTARKTQDPQ